MVVASEIPAAPFQESFFAARPKGGGTRFAVDDDSNYLSLDITPVVVSHLMATFRNPCVEELPPGLMEIVCGDPSCPIAVQY